MITIKQKDMEKILLSQWFDAALIVMFVLFGFFMAYFLAGAILDFAGKNTKKAVKYLLKSLVIAVGFGVMLKTLLPQMVPGTWCVTAFIIACGAFSEILRRLTEHTQTL